MGAQSKLCKFKCGKRGIVLELYFYPLMLWFLLKNQVVWTKNYELEEGLAMSKQDLLMKTAELEIEKEAL